MFVYKVAGMTTSNDGTLFEGPFPSGRLQNPRTLIDGYPRVLQLGEPPVTRELRLSVLLVNEVTMGEIEIQVLY